MKKEKQIKVSKCEECGRKVDKKSAWETGTPDPKPRILCPKCFYSWAGVNQKEKEQ